MIKINLVPVEILAKAERKQKTLQAIAAGVFLALIVVFISVGHYFGLSKLEHQLSADNGRLKQLEIIVAKVEELERTAAAVRARLNVITDLLKGRPLYPYFMAEFVRNVPAGIRVRTLSTSGGGSAAAPLKLTMTAEARANDDIASWVRRMEGTGRFAAIELGAVTYAPVTDIYSFSLTATYTPQL